MNMKRTFLIITTALTLALSANAQNWSSYPIGLDPGHGGSDPGAAGPSAPHEAELALRCATDIKNTLKKLGCTVYMTRTSNVDVSLTTRRDQSVSWDPYIFQSIHLNAFNGSAHGTETWYYWSAGNSNRLATKVQNQLVSQFKSVAGYATANRGVKQNGWTVITGSSNVPASLSEGLFVDYYNEWNLINDNNKNGFKGWVLGHLMGFYDHLGLFSSSLTNPSTVYNKTPQMTVSTNNIKFPQITTSENDYQEVTVTVTAKDLTSDMSYTLSNWNNFSVAENGWNARTGGKLVVRMHAYGNKYVGPNYGELKITGAGKTETIVLTGDSKAVPLTSLTEKWNCSSQRGTQTQKGWDATKVRNFCYSDGRLFMVYNDNSIKVVNAQTGADLGFMNLAPSVVGGDRLLSDVKFFDGHLIACNRVNNGGELRIYGWGDLQEENYLCLNTTDLKGATHLGECMELLGNLTNMRIDFGYDDNTETKMISYSRDNGAWSSSTTRITWQDGTRYPGGDVIRILPQAHGQWVDGNASEPIWTTWNDGTGSAVRNCGVPCGNNVETSHREFKWDGFKFAVNPIMNDYGKNCAMRLIMDHTGNFARTTEVGRYPSDGLGSGDNSQGYADVIINTDGSTWLEAWVLSYNQGVAYYTYGTPPTANPTAIQPLRPTIAAAPGSLSFSGTAYQQYSSKVTFNGKRLEGDIALSIAGRDADMFSLSTNTIAQSAASAEVTVTYVPDGSGSHEAQIVASTTTGETIYVPLTGTAAPMTELKDDISQMDEKWNMSGNTSMPSWSVSGYKIRSIDCLNGKTYVLQGKAFATPQVEILGAYDGNRIGTLNVEGVSTGVYYLSSIKAFDGKLIGSNVVDANGTLKVFKWKNDNTAPSTILQYTSTEAIGAQINASGNFSNGKLWFSNDNSSKVYVFTISNGNVNATPTIISLKKADGTEFVGGDGRGTSGIIDNGDGTFWLDGYYCYPTLFDTNGNYIGEIDAAALNNCDYGTASQFVNFGNRRYLVATTYASNSSTGVKTNMNCSFVLIDVTDGYENATSYSVYYPAAGLGSAANIDRISSIHSSIRNNNKTIDVWVAASGQGLASYSYNGEVLSGIVDPTTGAIVAYVSGDQLRIEGTTVKSAQIYNAAGALVASSASNTANIRNLAKGIYVVKITDVNGNIANRLITRK